MLRTEAGYSSEELAPTYQNSTIQTENVLFSETLVSTNGKICTLKLGAETYYESINPQTRVFISMLVETLVPA
jgi:hypothetical protein